MATQQSATVRITNNSGGNAWILLSHSNSSNGTQTASWTAKPGETVGPLAVLFETGLGTQFIFDYWSVLIHVLDGPAAGVYANSTSTDGGLECQLQHEDAGQMLTFSVSTAQFKVTLASGGCSPGSMTRLTPATPITHVFVVMLENHSFDNIFAMSGIKGITAATTSDSNTYNGTQYYVQPSAPLSMPTDPAHEFLDALEQLAGPGATYPSGGPYPPIKRSGYASNYATSGDEKTGLPSPDRIHDVMACFATPIQLPVLYQLATEFAICDHWYSSLPGPTWPNRFFIHGASSSGLDDSPTTTQMGIWETVSGFQYPNGSIYQAMDAADIPYRFYNDSGPGFLSLYSDDPQNGSAAGAVAQVSSLKGVGLGDLNSLQHFASDLQGFYPFPYTFIEPHYGDITGNTYAGGSSQHPMDDVYGGEHLLAAVYQAIRGSQYWATSLLIVTYDEHGGLYDSVAPPAAPAPGDHPSYGYTTHGFDFKQYGVRVPAVVVSPRIAAGTVDHTVYDHASVPKTLEELFGMSPLTQRDAAANSVLSLLTLKEPRTDCPAALNSPAPLRQAARAPVTAEERARIDALPVPRSGNLAGALFNLKKADAEVSGGTPSAVAAAEARHQAVQTRGQAREYAVEVLQKVEAARRQRTLARRGAPGSNPGS